jgi:hypothetical protein
MPKWIKYQKKWRYIDGLYVDGVFDPKLTYDIGNYYYENTYRHRKSRLLAWLLK